MLFWSVPGIVAVLFAVLALLQKTLYGSALCLLMVLLQVAALFFLAGAQMLAFLQVLVYAGAVMVLLVAAVIADEPRLARPWARLGVSNWLAGAFLLLPFAELAAFLSRMAPARPPVPGAFGAVLERGVGGLLFGPYAGMTELIGVLILVAALSALPERD